MMPAIRISGRDRRTILVGATFIASIVGLGRGLPALQQWEAERRLEADVVAQELARLRAAYASKGPVNDSLKVRMARLAKLDSVLLRGASPAALAASFAAMIGEVADESSVKVTALQLQSDSSSKSGTAHVQVRLIGVADVAGLAGFLRSVETMPTPARVREVTVSQAEPLASENKPEALRVDVVVEGLGIVYEGPKR